MLAGKSQGRSFTIITAGQGALSWLCIFQEPFHFSPCEGTAAGPKPLVVPRRMGSSRFLSPVPRLSGKGSPYGHRGVGLHPCAQSRRWKTEGLTHHIFIKAHSVCFQDFPFLDACLPTGVLRVDAHRCLKCSP